MLPLKYIRNNEAQVRKGLGDKGADINALDEILALDQKLRAINSRLESLRAEKNSVSRQIGQLKQAGESADVQLSAMGKLSGELKELDGAVQSLKTDLDERLKWIPNLPHESTPVGPDESGNVLVSTIGEPTVLGFEGKDHLTLTIDLGLLDFEAGSRMTGRGFPVYIDRGARLERALIQFMLDLHTQKHGYTEIFPPFMVNRASAFTTGQLPKLEEDMYYVDEDGLFLIPTAEVPVTNLYQGQILKEADFPVKLAAYSACFRREAGSYGKDTKGLQRVHQFNKVELVMFTRPATSYEELESLRAHAEKVLQLLGLHYRVLELCSGELSFAATKCYDLELFAPVSNRWFEVSSCSNFEAFQARRGNIRYRNSATNKLDFLHTLNGSGVATPRLMIALLENYQQADGSVKLPEALVPYYGEETISAL